MPSSYDRIIIHSIWSTKYREPWIDEYIEPELHAVMAAEFKKHGCIVFEIGGTEDHVHVVHSLPRTKSIAQVLGAVKSVSSGFMSSKDERYTWFAWQDGYGAFSVDYRQLDRIRYYVRNQREHHAQNGPFATFEEEYTAMLKAYGYADFPRKYVFPKRA